MERTPKPFAATLTACAVVLLTAGLLVTFPRSGHAGSSGAAFVGGLIGGHVLTNMANRSERRTRAAEYDAYSRQPAATPQQAPAPQPQGSATSVEAKLDTLDNLAAKGYISKEEYERRRQAILDSL